MNTISPTNLNTTKNTGYYKSNQNQSRISLSAKTPNDSFTKTKRSERLKDVITVGVSALAIGAAFAGYLYSKKAKPNLSTEQTQKAIDIIDKTTGKILLTAKEKINIEQKLSKYTKDVEYRKNLLTTIGVNPNDYALLRPIIGPQEYKETIKAFTNNPIQFTPGKTLINTKQDEYELTGVINKTFRFNGHNHTTYSDGELTLQELLDQSAQYADDIVKKVGSKKNILMPDNPYTIGITDHDSIEACKEAVKIISKNPQKYKNLRVSLGVELSVEATSLSNELNSPIEIHMLLSSINPFDKKLNTMIDNTKKHKLNLIKEFISDFSSKAEEVIPGISSKLNYEDSKNLYPALKFAHTHTYNSSKDYVQMRTMFSECVEKNTSLASRLKKKGIDTTKLNYLKPKEKYFNSIDDNFGNKYWNKYKKALDKYIAELLEVPENEAANMMKTTPAMEELFYYSEHLAHKQKPKLDLQPAYLDMNTAIDVMKKQENGYMGIAHPGLIHIGKSIKNPEESYQAINNLFKTFKERGGKKALFIEGYYPYYGYFSTQKDSKQWLDAINNYAKSNNLILSGSIDTHGKNIFYSQK